MQGYGFSPVCFLKCFFKLAHTEKDLGLADLMLYIGFFGTGYASGGGAAFFASVCDSGISGDKASVTVYGYSHSAVGGTLTHEV